MHLTALPELAQRLEDVWAAECQLWLARIHEADFSRVPLALQECGALASFADPVLATLPFTARCVPPRTSRAAPPEPQLPVAVQGPQAVCGFYPPGHFRTKADPWMCAQRDRLRDVLRNGAEATAPGAGTCIFGQHEMLAPYRGILWEYCHDAGRFVPTRTDVMVDTHLNRTFSALFSEGYDDQEFFSILDFGVNFKAPGLEMQLVLPDHLQSIAGGLELMQTDLVRRAGRGWYEIFSAVPRNPWRPQQAGSRAKTVGGKPTGKLRTIVNASFSHARCVMTWAWSCTP